MDCTSTQWSSSQEYIRALQRRAREERIPLSGSIDLTHRCNLDCIHCYLGRQADQRWSSRREMSASQVNLVLDQVVEAGCLELLITGGEPMLRRDFATIYRHAVESGLLVTVFTNGTLVTDEILALFGELPPQCVEVTVYGATPATHDRVTGVTGSFERCLGGVRRMLNRGVRARLKTILMAVNEHEFDAMRALAKSLGVKFRSDAALFPRFNGDRTPLDLRVMPEEAVTRELADDEYARKLRAFFERSKGLPASDGLYQCGAGLTNFHINARGILQPCLMARGYAYNLLTGSFEQGWRDSMVRIRERKAAPGYECNRCEIRSLCSLCPAFAESETGDEEQRSEYLCSLGHHRLGAIRAYGCTMEGS